MEKKYRVFSFFLLACYHNISFGKKEIITFFPCPPDEGRVWAAPTNRTSPSKKAGLMFQLFWEIFKHA